MSSRGPSIEDIEFLARSDHRAGVLDTLGTSLRPERLTGGATGAYSTTRGRVLADFEQRQWTVKDGPMYELTPLGEFVTASETENEDLFWGLWDGITIPAL